MSKRPTTDLFPPLCVDFPCHTQSMAASNRLDWQQNLSPLSILPFIKQGLVVKVKFSPAFFKRPRGSRGRRPLASSRPLRRQAAKKPAKQRSAFCGSSAFAQRERPIPVISAARPAKKDAPAPKNFGTRAPARFVVPPKFKAARISHENTRSGGSKCSHGRLARCLLWPPWYGEGAVGVSAPAPPLSFLRAERGAFSAAPLSGDRLAGLLLRRLCGERVDCIRFFRKCQAMGRVEGLTMYRQSRSPRARPSTSISAVAMLLAKGMLFWSHRREM